MARRGGRLGEWLATDDTFGITEYASRLRRDYWGNYTKKPLLRNPQEYIQPIADPVPVGFYRAPDYEATTAQQFVSMPSRVGLTNVQTSYLSAAAQALFLDGIGRWILEDDFTVS